MSNCVRNWTNNWCQSAERPPGPAGSHWILGDLLLFRTNPAKYLEKVASEYGGIALVPLVTKILLINDPALVREVLVSNPEIFVKDKRGRKVMSRALGMGLVTSEGSLHKRQRKLIQPAFQNRRIENYAPVMVDLCRQMLADWRDGEQRIVSHDMNRLTMGIAVKALFDANLSESDYAVGKAIARLQQLAMREFTRIVPMPSWLPTAANRAIKRERKELHAVVQRIIDEQREHGVDRGDLLSALVRAADEGDMSNQQLRDELVTLFAAGHETTANAMSWTWALISEHPEVEKTLHQELDTVLQGREPGLEDLPNLPYTEAVFKESLRLKPPVWLLNARLTLREITLGGYQVPKRSLIFVSPYTLHRNEKYFPDASSFKPERWIEPRATKLPRLAYMPFGAGHRVCIGTQFSMQEGVLLIASIAQRFSLKLIEPGDVPGSATITYGPAAPMAMNLTRR